jgi:hypothetical protein
MTHIILWIFIVGIKHYRLTQPFCLAQIHVSDNEYTCKQENKKWQTPSYKKQEPDVVVSPCMSVTRDALASFFSLTRPRWYTRANMEVYTYDVN